MTTYYAHSAQDKLGNLLPYEHWQTLQSHSVNVGEMAAEFARVFGAQEIACQTGQLHDLGKYSEPFNRRLHGGPSADHATAGAKIAVERWGNVIGKLMAFCIAGHHAGLANGSGEGDNRRTLKQRLALQFGADIPALDNLWQQEIKFPQNLSTPPLKADAHHPFFSYALNLQNKRAYEALGIEPNTKEKKLPKDEAKARDITAWMCKNFFDIRTFGAVMTTEVNSGQVRGPVQLAFAQSIDPIVPLEVSITRMAVTNEKDLEKERTMGRKYIVPYALYRVHGFISANLAAKTGFSDDDLAKLWQALTLMFEHDRSAARGEMAARKLIVFKHDSALGSQPAHKLFDAVKVERVNGESGTPASGFGDYKISVVSDGLNGVSVEELL